MTSDAGVKLFALWHWKSAAVALMLLVVLHAFMDPMARSPSPSPAVHAHTPTGASDDDPVAMPTVPLEVMYSSGIPATNIDLGLPSLGGNTENNRKPPAHHHALDSPPTEGVSVSSWAAEPFAVPSIVSTWLPTGQRLFCPSFDNTSYMWLQPERPFARDVPQHAVRIDECPHNPVVLLIVDNYRSALSAPVAVRKRSMKAAFRSRRLGKPQPKPLLTATSKLFVGEVYVRQTLIEERSGGHSDDGPMTHPNQTRQCLRHCLASPCCVGFQVLNDATHMRCHLLAARLDESQSDAPYPLPRRPMALLAQRREFRPSLNTDAWRLTVVRGPERVVVLQQEEGDPTSGDGRRPRLTMGNHSLIHIELHGAFGVLSHAWASGTATATLTTDCLEVDALGGSRRSGVGDVGVTASTTAGGTTFSVTVPMVRGVIDMDMVTAFPEAFRSSLEGPPVSAGATWCVSVVLDALEGAPPAVGDGVEALAPPPAREVRPVRICSLVVQKPAAFVVKWLDPKLATGAAIRATRLPPYIPHEAPGVVSRDPVKCAPYLRSTECCLPPLAIRLEDADGRLSAPDDRLDLRTGTFYAPRVDLLLDWGNVTLALRSCIRLIAGHQVLLDAAGRGHTANVIVDVTCSQATLDDNMGAALTLTGLYELTTTVSLALPVSLLRHCAASNHPDTKDSDLDPLTLPQPSLRGTADSASHHPVAFSLRAMGQVEFLQHQLATMFAFAPQSLVALHLSAQWKIRLREQSAMATLNASHPRTHINTRRLGVPPSKAAHVHACNFRFLLQNGIEFSHVIIWASNELLVRAGIEQYVKQFDLSHPGRVDPRDGVVYDNINIPLEWWSDEDHYLRRHHLWEFLPWDGVSQEHVFAATLRAMSAQEDGQGAPPKNDRPLYPAHQVYLEGAFFSRAMAIEFADVVEQRLPHDSFCTTSGQYANNEIIPFLMMRRKCDDGLTPALKCGGRVSTMLWREFFYFGSLLVLEETRCSPFATPFGWKRVKKTPQNSLMRALEGIAQDEGRRLLVRDVRGHCNTTVEMATQIRAEQKATFLKSI